MENKCNKCGSCCKAIVLSYNKEEIRERALKEGKQGDFYFAYKNFVSITEEQALKINPYLSEWPKDQEKKFYYYCKQFSEYTNQCSVYELRPDLCKNYPDLSKKEAFYSKDCGFNNKNNKKKYKWEK